MTVIVSVDAFDKQYPIFSHKFIVFEKYIKMLFPWELEFADNFSLLKSRNKWEGLSVDQVN
jgi:NADH:ubiquinone oxidoreductase subunit 3 (subunit A)